MNLLDSYYQLRPFLPRALQIRARRIVARQQRRYAGRRWPILESAGSPPAGWKGWPDGKQFAFVLTHDVETAIGHAHCREVMGIEEELGFRSSFSLVPERYTVSPELRAELQARGFEVAVHGLTHDGHLFRSYETFSERKPAINRYIKEWGAAGFRSPSMRRNLDWIGELNIEYDSSTFDTDPFEPESTGVETIFPFSVRASNGRSYIELPYSLPQDSTLFLILGEESIRIWKEKLDWVASKGGLALINTHPDYMSFDDRWPSSHMLYPIELYREFLQYARDRYADTMWHQLPCHVAQYCRSVNVASRDEASEVTRPVAPESPKLPSLRGKRVLMIVFSVYPADPRVRRAAEAIVEAGGDVDVLCLQHDDAPRTETIRGVHVSRARLRRKRAQKSRYMLEYSSFVAWASCQAAVRHLRRRYSVVHVHNMPDFLVFSAVVPKLLGAKLILDLHDPVPEMYMTKYSVGRDDRLIRVLTCLERKSLGFADAGITPNKAFRDLFVGRSCPAEEMTIVMNSPQEELFHPGKCENEALRDRQPGRFRLMYHGLIVERHGLDTAVRAVSRLRDEIPGIEFHVYGPGDSFVDTFQDLVNELKASDLVKYYGPIPLEEIAQRIHETDLGIIPNRRSPFTEINFPTRIFEYLSVERPVVVPRTKGIRDYFDEESILYFDPDSVDSLASAILHAHRHEEQVEEIVKRGIAIYRKHRWAVQKRRYLSLVESLVNGRAEPKIHD